MEAQNETEKDWWASRRTNYNYLLVSAGILAYLAFTAIYETFYTGESGTGKGMHLIGTILLLMARHLLIMAPYIAILMYAYRFFPKIEEKINRAGKTETRNTFFAIACLLAVILTFLPAAILVWIN